MNPRGDRSIRNIPVPAGHRHIEPAVQYEEEEVEVRQPRRVKKPTGKRNRFLWLLVAVVIICGAAGFLLSTVFAGANISVTPRTATATPPDSIVASPNAPTGSLSYQVVSTSRSASTTVNANGTQHVSRAATGVLTIYNAYDSNTQRLIANTRFEAPDGKIYRIRDSVVVPGMSGASPGTATVSAYADSPGADYNRGVSQFSIPGFKNDPRYTKFYAKTDQMSGGFVGDEVAVSPADLKAAQDLLKNGLEGALRTAAETQIPAEYLAIPGTLQISYNPATQTPADGGKAVVAQTAIATANIVKSSDLAAAIAKLTVEGYTGEAVNFVDSSQISIALATTTASANGPIQLKLSGTPVIQWQFDPNALKQALLGKSKNDFEKIVQSFAPAIQCTSDTPCKASIRPFWSSAFPSNPNKITVNVGE